MNIQQATKVSQQKYVRAKKKSNCSVDLSKLHRLWTYLLGRLNLDLLDEPVVAISEILLQTLLSGLQLEQQRIDRT